jgi:hypothetical protein
MLLGIGRMVLSASKPGELIAAHVVNFCIYVAALGCFEFFYRELRKATVATVPCTGDDSVRLPEWALWSVAHALFLWASLDLITVWDVSQTSMFRLLFTRLQGCYCGSAMIPVGNMLLPWGQFSVLSTGPKR